MRGIWRAVLAVVVSMIIGATLMNWKDWHGQSLHLHLGRLAVGLVLVVVFVAAIAMAIKNKHWTLIILAVVIALVVGINYRYLLGTNWTVLGIILGLLVAIYALAWFARSGVRRSRSWVGRGLVRSAWRGLRNSSSSRRASDPDDDPTILPGRNTI